MSISRKAHAAAAFLLLISFPAMAQTPSHEGDYYPPTNTTVQQPDAGQIRQEQQGDYYAASKTIVQQPSAAQIKQDKKGDYYAPSDK